MNNGSNFNGKINIMGPNISTKFSMMDRIPINSNSNFLNSLTGIFERSQLSDTFFSQQNIKNIQIKLKQGVYQKSNGTLVIDDQSEEVIVSIMKNMYLEHSKNLNTNIAHQVEELNNYVLNYCIPNVYNEAIAYLKYKEDSSKMHTPMRAPIYSNKTNKTLEMKPWF
tara:strand:+ start:1286 stop:1786 length:501 start_codon:yes stop_codon:yes gene_type:complete